MAASLVFSVALVLLRTYDSSQLPLPNKSGRMPAQTRLVNLYPDSPNTDPADVRNEVHRRRLLLAKTYRWRLVNTAMFAMWRSARKSCTQ